MKRNCLSLLLFFFFGIRFAAAETAFPADLAWTAPSEDSRGSMPLGNGDIGLNVWMEKSGDLLFYISKTDAWSDSIGSSKGLLKLGRVRVKLDPNPFVASSPFRQTLKVSEGAIVVDAGPRGGNVVYRVWVDANRPVVHVEFSTAKPATAIVHFETLRPTAADGLQADTIFEPPRNRVDWYRNRIAWCYTNQNKSVPRLKNLTFGAILRGDGLVRENDATLKSSKPTKVQNLAVHVLTAQSATPGMWLMQLEKQVVATDAIDLESARKQHAAWWNAFCERSWIVASGNADAEAVTQGYALQRFVTACAGRGAYPIKYNGSIFTMDWIKRENVKGVPKVTQMSADARDWGGQYWFQNTRPIYWPMLASGDYEMMLPLFRMYQDQLPGNTKAVREFYGHDGAYFAETNPFWGSLPNIKPGEAGSYTKHYFTPILELTAMMLDYYAYTGDQKFVRETLLPVADAGTKFFDQHWKREKGKLLLDPDNAIEMYWTARNPAPDLAGLRFDLAGLLALSSDLPTGDQRTRWKRLLAEVPELPKGETGGRKVLKPADVFGKGHNFENPELYAVYPFRLYGLGKPDIELARATFAARQFKTNGCWRQDGVQAALLGDVEAARKNVAFVLTRKDKQCRFPAFWDHGSDYVPDEDNGGNGVLALQEMLLQAEGDRIIVLPAWPKEWNVRFKLCAPMKTVVEGEVHEGKLLSLHTVPAERLQDVMVVRADGSLAPYKNETK